MFIMCHLSVISRYKFNWNSISVDSCEPFKIFSLHNIFPRSASYSVIFLPTFVPQTIILAHLPLKFTLLINLENHFPPILKTWCGRNFKHDVLTSHSLQFFCKGYNIVTDLMNALPGKSSVNTVQHATIEKAVFSVDLNDAPIGLAG
jgi:hypothetical protein